MNVDERRTLAMLQPSFDVQRDLLVPRSKLPEQLLAEIESSEDGKFLVAGQRGMGKTTELKRLVELLKKNHFPVFVQFGAQESITYPMLIDAMAQGLLRHPELRINTKLTRSFTWGQV